MSDPRSRLSELKTYAKEEMISHLPYTFIGVALGLVLVLLSVFFFSTAFGEDEFHLAHFTHVFFSAAAGAAIFRSYQDSVIKAVPVVFISSVFLCTLSDILIPVAGLKIFQTIVDIHVCFFELPWTVIAFVAGGFTAGFVGIRFFKHCNRGFHLMHILISTAASTFYMLSFIPVFSHEEILAVMVTLFFALVIPCLIGDVAVPLIFVKIREEFLHEKVHHA